jgi:hypothetical protein
MSAAVVAGLGALSACGGSTSRAVTSTPSVNCDDFRPSSTLWSRQRRRSRTELGPREQAAAAREVEGLLGCHVIEGLERRTVHRLLGKPDSINAWGASRGLHLEYWSNGDTGVEVAYGGGWHVSEVRPLPADDD